MKRAESESGFTIIELLISAALVLMIVSIVYGGYFATSKSVGLYGKKLESSGQALKILTKMNEQLRCCFAPRTTDSFKGTKLFDRLFIESLFDTENQAETVNYFNGRTAEADKVILSFVTTRALFPEYPGNRGLFEVCYKFDHLRRDFSISQTKFIPTAKTNPDQSSFRVLLKDISRMEFRFYDGLSWQDRWDYLECGRLPVAVGIRLFIRDNSSSEPEFKAVTYIPCQVLQSSSRKDKKFGLIKR